MSLDATPHAADRVDRAELRATIDALACFDRGPTSPGEAQAAAWLAERLRREGCEVAVEPAEAFASYAGSMAALAACGLAATALAGLGARRGAAALGTAAALAIADDAQNVTRSFRRATMRPRPTQNVVAALGDPDAPQTLVVLAHHDAAPTGRIFDPKLQRAFGTRLPTLIERIDTSLPLWAPVIGGPALAAVGALRRSRRTLGVAAVLSAGATAAFADIAGATVVPGANDNLTAVAALVALAAALRERPVAGLRVLLVSAGAEESLQGGIHGFGERHFPTLDLETTSFVNLDTIGSPRLVMLEGEGPVLIEDYPRKELRDLVARCADRERITLRRGMRGRVSTDAIVPARAGYATVTLASVDRHKALSNYHLPSDTPDNVDYATVAKAVALVEAVARELTLVR